MRPLLCPADDGEASGLSPLSGEKRKYEPEGRLLTRYGSDVCIAAVRAESVNAFDLENAD
jgi:hypothetical protein